MKKILRLIKSLALSNKKDGNGNLTILWDDERTYGQISKTIRDNKGKYALLNPINIEDRIRAKALLILIERDTDKLYKIDKNMPYIGMSSLYNK